MSGWVSCFRGPRRSHDHPADREQKAQGSAALTPRSQLAQFWIRLWEVGPNRTRCYPRWTRRQQSELRSGRRQQRAIDPLQELRARDTTRPCRNWMDRYSNSKCGRHKCPSGKNGPSRSRRGPLAALARTEILWTCDRQQRLTPRTGAAAELCGERRKSSVHAHDQYAPTPLSPKKGP